jgi:aconitate hydratase
MTIFDAAMQYKKDGVPLIVLAGKEYGTGSSRDWAAKGPMLLGVRAVIAESFERIHRSNLVGMGILPLEFMDGDSTESLGLTGHEQFTIQDVGAGLSGAFEKDLFVGVSASGAEGEAREFKVRVRLDTPQEVLYYRHRGILQYVLRQLLVVD